MSAMTFFYQACPVCGRSLRVAVKYFGKEMCCSHCGGEFRAGDFNGSQTPDAADSTGGRVDVDASGVVLHADFGAAQVGEV
jgi:hypothetical protein